MKRWMVLFLVAMMFVSLFVLSCDEDEDDDQDDDVPDTWTDSQTDLVWQNVPPQIMNWEDAQTYCQNLSLGGIANWRLPDLDEMRSLIRGCQAMQTGGECTLTTQCLEDACDNEACDGCKAVGGPGKSGRYCDPSLADEGSFLWTSTSLPDDTDSALFVNFLEAVINNGDKASNELSVRCVR